MLHIVSGQVHICLPTHSTLFTFGLCIEHSLLVVGYWSDFPSLPFSSSRAQMIELEASHGNPDAIAELRKEIGSLRTRSDLLDREGKQKDKVRLQLALFLKQYPM